MLLFQMLVYYEKQKDAKVMDRVGVNLKKGKVVFYEWESAMKSLNRA